MDNERKIKITNEQFDPLEKFNLERSQENVFPVCVQKTAVTL